MRICAVGWYGTETIGDRAIFAGLLHIFNLVTRNMDVKLGSLYPFYSRRMLMEDTPLYEKLINKKIQIDIFNSSCEDELKKNILQSDLVIVAGGPLMDLDEMYMLRYAFGYAKKKNKKCLIAGCGVGPLFREEYQRCLLDIVSMSDGVIFRDAISKKSFMEIADKFQFNINEACIETAIDPAVICAYEYKNCMEVVDDKKYIAINFRDFPMEYTTSMMFNKYNVIDFVKKMLEEIRHSFNEDMLLVPMHYFCVGNDDRYFLNKLAMQLHVKNVYVQNVPLSLQKTMDVYAAATLDVGMRFHSVVLQTILNGNNYIVDYTEPKKGKIFGFLQDIDQTNFYCSRCVNLQDSDVQMLKFDKEKAKFSQSYINAYYEQGLKMYLNVIEKVIL
ncbi:MAG: polysaccharide pyruvyl transferase family protein [Anaerovibrio sp.]